MDYPSFAGITFSPYWIPFSKRVTTETHFFFFKAKHQITILREQLKNNIPGCFGHFCIFSIYFVCLLWFKPGEHLLFVSTSLVAQQTHTFADARTSKACACLNNKAVPSSLGPQVSDPYTTAITHKHTMQTGFTSMQGVGCPSHIRQKWETYSCKYTHTHLQVCHYGHISVACYCCRHIGGNKKLKPISAQNPAAKSVTKAELDFRSLTAAMFHKSEMWCEAVWEDLQIISNFK